MSAAVAEGNQPAPELRLVWEPLEIGSTRVKNRIMMTAQTTLFGRDNVLGDRHIEFFRERAKGGAALFITEQQAGHRISKGSFFEGCSAWEKRAIPQYAKLADAVHEHGARQFVQLFGCGVHDKGTMIMDEWHPLWGVSKMPSIVHHEMPMVMEQEHVGDVVKGFAESALNVKVAGCDGVELHAAHSYLLGQFLSPAFNDRTDRYGGSVRGRCQVILEIGEAVRALVGDDFTVGVRLSFDEFMGDAGITPDQSEEQLEVLSTSGFFDFFNISGGGYYTLHRAVSPMNIENGFMLPFARRAKAVVGNRAKVFAVGPDHRPATGGARACRRRHRHGRDDARADGRAAPDQEDPRGPAEGDPPLHGRQRVRSPPLRQPPGHLRGQPERRPRGHAGAARR